MVDLGLHTGGIQPQLAPLCHLGLPGQLDDAVVERMQRFGVQRVGPTDQCAIIGRWFPEQATEPSGPGATPGSRPPDLRSLANSIRTGA